VTYNIVFDNGAWYHVDIVENQAKESTMKTQQVVFEFCGMYDTQNAVVPLSLLSDFTGDLTATVIGNVSFDDFRLCEYPKYQIRTKQLPEQIDFKMYCRYSFKVNCMVVQLGELVDTIPAVVLRYLLISEGTEWETLLGLYKTTKSAFRLSLRAQLETWCAQWDKVMNDYTYTEKLQYDFPLSQAQWAALTKYQRR
jgi:hypothetical protein